jgi:hypothetical protein
MAHPPNKRSRSRYTSICVIGIELRQRVPHRRGGDVIDRAVHRDGRLIVLRDWRIPDLTRDATWSVPGQRWKELDGPYYPLPRAEETAAFVARKRAEIEGDAFPHPRSTLAIADKATDEFLGLVSWYWESQETHWPCVGLVIYAWAWSSTTRRTGGRGAATTSSGYGATDGEEQSGAREGRSCPLHFPCVSPSP